MQLAASSALPHEDQQRGRNASETAKEDALQGLLATVLHH